MLTCTGLPINVPGLREVVFEEVTWYAIVYQGTELSREEERENKRTLEEERSGTEGTAQVAQPLASRGTVAGILYDTPMNITIKYLIYYYLFVNN